MGEPLPGFDKKGRAFGDYKTKVQADASVSYRVMKATLVERRRQDLHAGNKLRNRAHRLVRLQLQDRTVIDRATSRQVLRFHSFSHDQPDDGRPPRLRSRRMEGEIRGQRSVPHLRRTGKQPTGVRTAHPGKLQRHRAGQVGRRFCRQPRRANRIRDRGIGNMLERNAPGASIMAPGAFSYLRCKQVDAHNALDE